MSDERDTSIDQQDLWKFLESAQQQSTTKMEDSHLLFLGNKGVGKRSILRELN